MALARARRAHAQRRGGAGRGRGHARLNGNRVRAPGHALRIGDVVTLALDRRVRVLEVGGFSERRGGPSDAAATYRDLTGRDPTGKKTPG